jgi:sulfate adenylyltransferase
VGDYYGPFDAHHIFDKLWPNALVTQALKIDITFFCKKCDGMATGKTCPCGENERVNISGTELREMLSKGLEVPIEFGRPEVVALLRKYYATLDQ